MSNEVKRYVAHGGWPFEHCDGDWVTHADYAALEAECERLRGEVKKLTHETELGLNAYCQVQAERDALRAELAAIKAQEPLAYMLADAVGGSMLEFQQSDLLDCQQRYGGRIEPLYALPPLSGQIEKYDDVLLPFLAMMRAELHANSGKGDRPGWLAMDKKTSLLEIFYHLGKLQKAVKDDNQGGIREYSADVANMSMMLADICGVLTVGAKE